MAFKLRRRDLLRSAAASAFLWPAIRASMADAAPANVRRFVTLFTPNGLNYVDAGPTGGTTSFDMGDYYRPLEEHRADLVALSKMATGGQAYGQVTEYGHQSGGIGCFTCTPDEKTRMATGPSIDQLIARKLQEQGLAPFLRAPVFSVGPSGTTDYGHAYYEASGVPVPLVNDPVAAFDSLFGEILAGQNGPDPSVLLARKKSILDAAWADCKSYVPELPGEGRAIVDYHCDRLRELEKNLEGVFTATCTPPEGTRAAVVGLDRNDPDNYPALTDAFFQMIEVALLCDITRVASFSFGNCAYRFNMPWVNPPLLATVNTGETNVRDHHSHTHAGNRESVGLFMSWYAQKVAELVTRLKTVQPDGSRLLDSTIVYWSTEYGDNPHENHDVPMFVFGNAGGKIATGRRIEKDNDPKHTHALMVSLIDAMGITGVDQFGHPGGGSGPLVDLAG